MVLDLSLFIDYEKYKQIKHEVPYLYKLRKQNQHLYYFGVSHSNNPSDLQFVKLKYFFEDFLKNTSQDKDRIVFIEGKEILADSLFKNEEEVIEKFGERGLILGWSLRNSLKYVFTELSLRDEAKILTKEFTKDEIVYFYVIREVSSFLRKDNSLTFMMALEKSLKKWSNILQRWDSSLFTKKKINQTHKELFGLDIYEESISGVEELFAPIYHRSVINEISRKSTYLRDFSVLENIEKEWKKGKSVFVVYGFSHAVQQEPVLRRLCES